MKREVVYQKGEWFPPRPEEKEVLRRILDVLEDQRTRLELSGRIEELEERVSIDPDRIAEELFS